MADNAARPYDFNGLRLLIVEDEMMLALSLEDLLVMMGCEITKAASVNKALEALQNEAPDGAILDLNLADGWAFPIAAELETRDIPYIFLSGYNKKALPKAYAHRQMLLKPVRPETLEQAIGDAFA